MKALDPVKLPRLLKFPHLHTNKLRASNPLAPSNARHVTLSKSTSAGENRMPLLARMHMHTQERGGAMGFLGW